MSSDLTCRTDGTDNAPKKRTRPGTSRNQLVLAARDLMLSKGYAATSVDQICARAGVTKGAFFHHFKNKKLLGVEVLRQFTENMTDACFCEHGQSEREPVKAVLAFIDNLSDRLTHEKTPDTCLLAIFTQELAETCPDVHLHCRTHFERWRSRMRQLLQCACDQQGSAICTAGLADLFMSVVEGSLILSRAHQDREIIRRNLMHLKRYFTHLMVLPVSASAQVELKEA